MIFQAILSPKTLQHFLQSIKHTFVMAAFTRTALNETQSIAVGCQIGKFPACPKGSQVPFFGCCNPEIDPCKDSCVGNSPTDILRPAGEQLYRPGL